MRKSNKTWWLEPVSGTTGGREMSCVFEQNRIVSWLNRNNLSALRVAEVRRSYNFSQSTKCSSAFIEWLP